MNYQPGNLQGYFYQILNHTQIVRIYAKVEYDRERISLSKQQERKVPLVYFSFDKIERASVVGEEEESARKSQDSGFKFTLHIW